MTDKNYMYILHLGHPLLTWINFNAWTDNHIPSKVLDEITYPFPNVNGWTIQIWEWVSNVVPHFIMDRIIYPYWD